MSEDSQELPPAKKQRMDTEECEEGERADSPPPERNRELVVNPDKYTDFVTVEEVEKLREFQVLDEVKSNDEDSNDDSDSSDGKSEGIPEDEIEKMLDEDLPEGFKGAPKPKEKAYVTRQKIVLEEKVVDQFEVLPLDWMMVRHYSGMPVYMHRATRVCTLSKPYFLGKGNTRRHEIPISAIPCYAYRRALEEEEKQKEIDRRIAEQIRTGSWRKNYNAANNPHVVVANCQNSTENNIETNGNVAVVDITNCDNKESTHNGNIENGDVNHAIDLDANNENELQNQKECSTSGNAQTSTPQCSTSGDGPSKCPFNHSKSDKPEVEIPLNRQPVVLPGGIVMPPPKVETVNTSWKTQHLTPEQVNDYCKALFNFKTVNIILFKRWADRRKYTRARKALQYPTLPEGTKLITIPANPNATSENGSKVMKRDWVMNMDGRSYLSVFHEYVRRALQKQPVYEFKQLGEAFTTLERVDAVPGDGVHRRHAVRRGAGLVQAPGQVGRRARLRAHPHPRDEGRARRAHGPHAAAHQRARLHLLRLRGHRGPAHRGVLRRRVRAVAARHPAHVPAAELRRRRLAHTHRDEEAGVPEDRADDEGGQALGHGGVQEQEDGQAARLAGHPAGAAPPGPVVGLPPAPVRAALREELQGEEDRGTRDHTPPGQGPTQRAQLRRAREAAQRDEEAQGEGRGSCPNWNASADRRSADALRVQPQQSGFVGSSTVIKVNSAF